MRLDKMTIKLQEALSKAKIYCEQNKQPYIECEHLLLELLKDRHGIVTGILNKTGINLKNLVIQLENCCSKLPNAKKEISQIQISLTLKSILNKAFEECSAMKDEFLNVEHILLAICENSNSNVARLFFKNGITTRKKNGVNLSFELN